MLERIVAGAIRKAGAVHYQDTPIKYIPHRILTATIQLSIHDLLDIVEFDESCEDELLLNFLAGMPFFLLLFSLFQNCTW